MKQQIKKTPEFKFIFEKIFPLNYLHFLYLYKASNELSFNINAILNSKSPFDPLKINDKKYISKFTANNYYKSLETSVNNMCEDQKGY